MNYKLLKQIAGITYFQLCVNVIGLPIDLKHIHWKGNIIENKSKFHYNNHMFSNN